MKEKAREEEISARLGDESDVTNSKSNNGCPIFISNRYGNSNDDDDWELTWPIWHMLPRMERKQIAFDHGMSIGEFEEYMSLSRALHVKNETDPSNDGTISNNNNKIPFDNSKLYKLESRPNVLSLPTVAHNMKGTDFHHSSDINVHQPLEHMNEEDDIDFEKLELAEKKRSTSTDDNVNIGLKCNDEVEKETDLSQELSIQQGGYIMILPPELQHFIFRFLPVDYYALCSLVSRLWHNFTMNEPSSYKTICQRLYLQQSKRKALNVSRFTGGFYRSMLIERPRVKVQAGLYVLKYSHIKKIQRDMWTEIPAGAILESTYYRYLYFHENNRVLYALTSAPPHEMISQFLKMKRSSGSNEGCLDLSAKNKIAKSAVWAYYEVKKSDLSVHISHPWHDVRMHLKILPSNEQIGTNGIYHTLRLERHLSSQSGDFDEYYSRDLVEYDVPSQPFQFLRDWRL